MGDPHAPRGGRGPDDAGTAGELRDLLRTLDDVGADEVHLIPTSTDLAQLEAAMQVTS